MMIAYASYKLATVKVLQFSEMSNTIIRWFDEVIAYFDNGTNSGTIEGINNKLKLIKRSGYGFRNFENFRVRCY